MTLAVRHTSAFKRDYKRLLKRGFPLAKLHAVVAKLRNGEELAPANRDHALSGVWSAHRECHIAPDWLLIYEIHADVLILELTRSGSHSDLFGN
ncbi:MAG: type II toxin-antitoxin system YafQ family toxin [Kiritimatiellae bacterium]|nr:type II toxin-antitoxin system YafQ family toxin [Kiritimatiellia bacterium]